MTPIFTAGQVAVSAALLGTSTLTAIAIIMFLPLGHHRRRLWGGQPRPVPLAQRTVPAVATRGRPPWDDLGPRCTRAPHVTPAGHAAARTYAAWLAWEAGWRAEAAATKPWGDSTGTFAAVGRGWAA